MRRLRKRRNSHHRLCGPRDFGFSSRHGTSNAVIAGGIKIVQLRPSVDRIRQFSRANLEKFRREQKRTTGSGRTERNNKDGRGRTSAAKIHPHFARDRQQSKGEKGSPSLLMLLPLLSALLLPPFCLLFNITNHKPSHKVQRNRTEVNRTEQTQTQEIPTPNQHFIINNNINNSNSTQWDHLLANNKNAENNVTRTFIPSANASTIPSRTKLPDG